MFRSLSLLLLFLVLLSCKKKDPAPEICNGSVINQELSYNELVAGLPGNLVTKLVEVPNEEGALGRNKEAYIHVRFQLPMTRLVDYAIYHESKEALSKFVQSLEYAFAYQRSEGDFEFQIPEELKNDPKYSNPSQGDLASGTVFFAYSAGLSLLSLQQSGWYNSTDDLEALQLRIENLRPKLLLMLNFLKMSQKILEQNDSNAPNRLLYDALAFYALGSYFQDQSAIAIGVSFANKALGQRDVNEGYFIEGGGWDSSYNGVAIQIGLEIYSLLQEESQAELKQDLALALSCATAWQLTRVMDTGEISTEGNTRVYPDGEQFLGREKDVDVIATLKSFYYMSHLSADPHFQLAAERIIQFYF